MLENQRKLILAGIHG